MQPAPPGASCPGALLCVSAPPRGHPALLGARPVPAAWRLSDLVAHGTTAAHSLVSGVLKILISCIWSAFGAFRAGGYVQPALSPPGQLEQARLMEQNLAI